MQIDMTLFDFILNAHPVIKAMVFIFSINLIWFGVVLWNETKKFNQLMKDLKAQPDVWAKFKETGDDYHFMKKDKEQ